MKIHRRLIKHKVYRSRYLSYLHLHFCARMSKKYRVLVNAQPVILPRQPKSVNLVLAFGISFCYPLWHPVIQLYMMRLLIIIDDCVHVARSCRKWHLCTCLFLPRMLCGSRLRVTSVSFRMQPQEARGRCQHLPWRVAAAQNANNGNSCRTLLNFRGNSACAQL